MRLLRAASILLLLCAPPCYLLSQSTTTSKPSASANAKKKKKKKRSVPKPPPVSAAARAHASEDVTDMLDRTAKDPAKFIDLMELQYLALAFGFAGKYQVQDRGQDKLLEIWRGRQR